MNTKTASSSATEEPSINGRSYTPFPRKQMTVNTKIGFCTCLTAGQIVWACGRDGNVYAIATTMTGSPERFVARQFLGTTEED